MSQVPVSKTQAQEVFCREFTYRESLKYVGLTLTIIALDGNIVMPTQQYRSRTGAHGTDIYCLDQESWSRAWVVTLIQSNSGKRRIYFENVPKEWTRLIEYLWVTKGVSVDDLKNVLAFITRPIESDSDGA
jgi:hypothetical protein